MSFYFYNKCIVRGESKLYWSIFEGCVDVCVQYKYDEDIWETGYRIRVMLDVEDSFFLLSLFMLAPGFPAPGC